MNASILKQFLALYFVIICSWQHSSSGSSESFILFFFQFFLFFHKCLLACKLRKTYAVLWAANPFLGLETAKPNDFANFENLNAILNISQETHIFSVSTDPVIICIYLKITYRLLREQGNVFHPP